MNITLLEEAFRWIVGILQKHGIPFQITGGFAAHLYGSGRLVNDIDIDIPEERMPEIVSDVREFIHYGPAQYKDERWDLLLMTLNYKGQLIDVGGARDIRICDARTGEWKDVPSDLSAARTMKIFDLGIPVVHPEHLFAYKQMLAGNHQKEDIEAVRKYIQNNQMVMDTNS